MRIDCKVKTNRNGILISILSLMFCGTVYFLMSIVSILHFGHNLKGNVLENVADMESSASILTISIKIAIVFFILEFLFSNLKL